MSAVPVNERLLEAIVAAGFAGVAFADLYTGGIADALAASCDVVLLEKLRYVVRTRDRRLVATVRGFDQVAAAQAKAFHGSRRRRADGVTTFAVAGTTARVLTVPERERVLATGKRLVRVALRDLHKPGVLPPARQQP